MNIIYENQRKSESYLPHELNTRYYAVLSYRNGNKATYVCRKYHISKASLSRWNRKFDGTKESLKEAFPPIYNNFPKLLIEESSKLALPY